jgi:hypothetical protein
VGVLKEPGNMAVETDNFGEARACRALHELLADSAIDWPKTPLNLSVLLAVGRVGVVAGCSGRSRAATRCARWAVRPKPRVRRHEHRAPDHASR